MKISDLPIHIFLFSIIPLFLLYAENVDEIPAGDIILPTIISFFVIAIAWFFLKYIIGNQKSALILSSILAVWIILCQIRIIFVFEEYEGLEFIGSNKILIPLFLVIIVPLIIFIKKRTISKDATSIVNVISIVIVSFLIFQVINFDAKEDFDIEVMRDSLRVPILHSDVEDKPDVYLIILDAYSGDITLERDYNFDNSKFKNELRERGFFVQKPSYSNYPNTEAAIPSIMNMMYLDSINETVGKNSNDKKILIELIEGNNVMDIFHENGYHITNFYGGAKSSPSSDNEYEIVCGRGLLNMNEDLQRSIVETYFSVAFLRHMLYDDLRYHDLECIISNMLEFEKKYDRPQYIHSHLFLPHPPFLYDANGDRASPTYSTDRFDENLRDAYLEQTLFANKIALEMIDSIQKRNDNAVIIVMSDHGGRLGIDWYNPTEMDYYRGFNNLSAFYFPGHEDEIPEKVATVNTFRVFFNTYFNTDYEILEDRQMWYIPERPYDQTDVTEKLLKN